jgi:acetyl-CoA synthetase
MANKNIVSVLLEERSFAPPPEFTQQARLKPADVAKLREEASKDHVGFWAEMARKELQRAELSMVHRWAAQRLI